MKKFKIKNSFIKKLFFSLIILYIIVFLLLFVFQGLIFKQFYTQKTIANTINEIDTFIETTNYENLSENIVNFSQNTQTTSLAVPFSQIQGDITQLNLILINIVVDGDVFSIIVPNLVNTEYEIGNSVVANLYLHSPTGNYVPAFLSLNGKVIIRSRMGNIDSIYQDLIYDLDSTQIYKISGTIESISPINQLSSSEINPIISNEILNIITGNYGEAISFENGQYYISENDTTNVSNMVFISNLSINNEPYVLISVFPVSHITDIVSAMQLMNIYIFIIVLSVLVTASLIYSKQFAKPLLYINNITKELSQLNFHTPLLEINTQDEFAELSKNINTLSINLKTTLDQLEEQNKQLSLGLDRENQNESSRREFVSGMSHELKTPLSVIQASAEALEKDIFDSEEDKLKSLILIQKEVQKTNKMINNMLAIYKIDNATYTSEWQKLDLKDVTSRINDNLKQLYTNLDIEVTLDLVESIIEVETSKIEIIINNLFTNAIKYTPKGGKIKVSIANIGNQVRFEIINYNAHIDDEHLDKLFDAFYRIDKSRSRDEGSTGLGLYIVQQALSQYDSKCIVKNLDNSVSFSFQLKKVISLD